MLRLLTIVSCLALLVIAVSACGGGSKESPLQPRPVPSEYQGLTMEELKARSKTPEYEQLRDNIDSHEGDLVWFEGVVDQVWEGSDPNTFQIYINVTRVTELGSREVDKWRDPVMLLYSSERGPELQEGNMVQFSGTVEGLYTTKEQYSPGSSLFKTISRPMISVIKAEMVAESD